MKFKIKIREMLLSVRDKDFLVYGFGTIILFLLCSAIGCIKFSEEKDFFIEFGLVGTGFGFLFLLAFLYRRKLSNDYNKMIIQKAKVLKQKNLRCDISTESNSSFEVILTDSKNDNFFFRDDEGFYLLSKKGCMALDSSGIDKLTHEEVNIKDAYDVLTQFNEKQSQV